VNKKIKNDNIDIERIVEETKKQTKDEMLILVHSIKNTLDTTVNYIKSDVQGVVKKVDDLNIKFETMAKDLSLEIRRQFEEFMKEKMDREIVENNFANELDRWSNTHCTEDERIIVKEMIAEKIGKKTFRKKLVEENKLQLSKIFLIIFTNVSGSVLVGIILYFLLHK
jgi:hypothetical protein